MASEGSSPEIVRIDIDDEHEYVEPPHRSQPRILCEKANRRSFRLSRQPAHCPICGQLLDAARSAAGGESDAA